MGTTCFKIATALVASVALMGVSGCSKKSVQSGGDTQSSHQGSAAKSGSTEGVSKWLFVGQVASSVGFTVYSVLTGNMVFIVTNAVLLLSNITGVYIYFRNREKNGGDDEEEESVLGRTDFDGPVDLNRGKAGGDTI